MRIKLEVAEPRDFDAGDGSSVIACSIDEALSGEHTYEVEKNRSIAIQAPRGEKEMNRVTDYWLVAACPEVSYEDWSFKSLLLTPRYRLKKRPIDIVKAGQELVVNAVWRHDGGDWDASSIEAARAGELEVDGLIVARVIKDEQDG